MTTIDQSIDQGFSEARATLAGLKILEGNIAGNIDQTITLDQDGLNAL